MFDSDQLQRQFSILQLQVYCRPLVYLDNAATTHKPQVVLDALTRFYTTSNSNIHRGTHCLSEQASAAYEQARATVGQFLHAASPSEIVFTSGATAAINLLANSFGNACLAPGDSVLISEMEHHSNLVPWQMLCVQHGAELRVIPFTDAGYLDLAALDQLLSPRTKLVALTYVSNVLGVVNPVKQVIAQAHARNIPVLIDAAQAIQHLPIDVQDLDCDFLVFSGHKIYAETGIGVLYGKQAWLQRLPPSRFGGGMITDVTMQHTRFAEAPYKFEAGTPNIAGAISLDAALQFLTSIGWPEIIAHEQRVLDYATAQLRSLADLTIYAADAPRRGVVAFTLDNHNAYDVGLILDKCGIAVRTGKHCADPVMQHYGIDSMIRSSFALYNTCADVDALVQGIALATDLLGTT